MSIYSSIFNRFALPGALFAALGCGDESSSAAPQGGDDTANGPLYVMMVQVLGPDGEDRTVYAVLSDSLDVASVSLDGAREFSGVANFAAVGGRLLVSDGDAPRVQSFEITDRQLWIDGDAVSFADYPIAADGANIFYQAFLDEQTAYVPFDISKRVVWNPSDMTIIEAKEASSVPLMMGAFMAEIGGNRTGVQYDGAVMQPFFYHDDEWFEFAPVSKIAVYDRETHEEQAVIDAPCPGLAIATRDEAGNTYFSSWDYSPGQALYGLASAPCAVRIDPGMQLDTAWTTDLTAWTEGRMAINFRYLGGGKGIAQVLHDEWLGLDLSAEYDPSVEDVVWTGGGWNTWFFDLEAQTARPLEGIEPGVTGVQVIQIEGRTFLSAGYDSGGSTIAYELDAEGELTERFRSTGEVFKWIRVR